MVCKWFSGQVLMNLRLEIAHNGQGFGLAVNLVKFEIIGHQASARVHFMRVLIGSR
jgi:hypothetical protein